LVTNCTASRNSLLHAPAPVLFRRTRCASVSLDPLGHTTHALTSWLLPSLQLILTCATLCLRACVILVTCDPFRLISYETWFYWTGIDQWSEFVVNRFADVPFPDHLKGHSTHPVRSPRMLRIYPFLRICQCSRDSRIQFCWLEQGQEQLVTPIGGRGLFLPPSFDGLS
jgi:hypothetical protein